MIKLIVGAKGSGKTKTMIDMINNATKTTSGNIVVIEKSMKLTTEINHAARWTPMNTTSTALICCTVLLLVFWLVTMISPNCSLTAS